MTIPGHMRGERWRWPHWLRHAWGDWEPGTYKVGDILMEYDHRTKDIRTCMLCSRRQMRSI